MEKSKIVRIRPISWKIFVQGQRQAQHVRELLQQHRFRTSDPTAEPDLLEPPVYGFTVTAADGTTLMSVELQALLEQFEEIEPHFNVL